MNGRLEPHWLVRPATIKLLWRVGLAVLALLVLGDFAIDGHPFFGPDGWFGFYAAYGLAGCLAMILFAKGLSVFLSALGYVLELLEFLDQI